MSADSNCIVTKMPLGGVPAPNQPTWFQHTAQFYQLNYFQISTFALTVLRENTLLQYICGRYFDELHKKLNLI